METIIKFLINKKVFSFFLMTMLFVAGVYSLLKLPRESQPEVSVPIVVVNTSYVGAKAVDIEKDITDEIEREIDKIKKVKKITSVSSDNNSNVVIEFEQEVDIDEKEDEVQKSINKIKYLFPEDASEPKVNKVEITDKPVYVFSISSNENNYVFKEKLDNLKDDIEKIDGVSEVTYTGSTEYQYSLYIKPKKLKQYNLSILQVFSILKNSNIKTPIGSIEVENITYPLETNSRIKSIDDLEKIVILKKNGVLIYLSDIAEIKKEFSDKNNFSNTYLKNENIEKRSSVFYIKKEQGYNVQDVVNRIKEYLKKENDKIEKQIKDGVDKTKIDAFLKSENISIMNDWGALIKKDLVDLSINGLMTTALVFILLLSILGFKDSLIASFGVPFSFVLSFIAFYIFGNTLNFISLFSLILAIGILVDSDIVMSEGIEKRIKKGLTAEQASIEAVKDLSAPMFAGTLTTVAVFAPLMFLSGTTGEFIRSIPFTVIFVILASQLVSIFAIPVLHSTDYTKFSKIIKNILIFSIIGILIFKILEILKDSLNFEFNKKLFSFLITFLIFLILNFKKIILFFKNDKEDEKDIERLIEKEKIIEFKKENKKTIFDKMENWYKKKLASVLKSFWKKFFIIIFAFSIFAFSVYLPVSGKIKKEFFPGGDVLYVNINIEMPDGYTKKDVIEYMQKVSKNLQKENGITDMVSTAGSTSTFSKTISWGENYGNIFLKLTKESQENGQEFTKKIQDFLKEKNFKYASAKKSEDGPPTGASISFNIISNDQEKVSEYTEKAEKILQNINGVININTQLEKNKTSFYIDINKEKAKILNINESDIYNIIRMTTEGVELFDISDNSSEDDIKVVFINNNGGFKNIEDFKKVNPEDILNLKIKNSLGEEIYLSEFASLKLKKYQSKIYHYNRENSLKIEAENEKDYNLNDIVKEFKEEFQKINNNDEVALEFGGAFSEQQKNFSETFAIFMVGLMIVFGILIFYFNSIWLPIVIESVILFAFAGSTIGLWLTGKAISFPSMIGLITVSGVVVNNSIMLIHGYAEKVKKRKKLIDIKTDNKKSISEIVVSGSAERLRPIILTVITTVIGVSPLIFSSPIWSPIVYVMIFGLLFSTFITLFFIPIVYFWTFRFFQKSRKK